MVIIISYQTLPGIIWTVIPRAWEKKRYCITTFNELCWIQSIYKHIGEHSGFSWKDDWWDNILLVRKKICLKPLKLNVKFFLVAIWKKEKWLLYWPLDLKTYLIPHTLTLWKHKERLREEKMENSMVIFKWKGVNEALSWVNFVALSEVDNWRKWVFKIYMKMMD